MITTEECRKYLKDKNLSDARIEQVRDYLYALAKEIANKNIEHFEKSQVAKMQN